MLINYLKQPLSLSFKDAALETRFQTHYLQVFLQQNRIAALLAIVIIASFSPWDYYVHYNHPEKSQYIRFGLVIPIALTLLLITFTSWFKRYNQTLLGLFLFAELSAIILLSKALISDSHYPIHNLSLPLNESLGINSGIGLLNISLALIFSGTVFAARFHTTVIVTLATFIVYSWFFYIELDAHHTIYSLYGTNLGAAALITLYSAFKREENLRRLFLSNERSDQLLNQAYPSSVVKRLKAGESAIADEIPQATVLFADLTGFTRIAANHSARDVVSMLNHIFSQFDDLVDDLQIEKIKTIGDGYLAISSVQSSGKEQAEQMLTLAYKMQWVLFQYRQQNPIDLHLKIGIHSGEVIGGIIGNKRPFYDIWGDTVNMASRLETTCLPDNIHISNTVQQSIKKKHPILQKNSIKKNGIYIKGKGRITTYYITPKFTVNRVLSC